MNIQPTSGKPKDTAALPISSLLMCSGTCYPINTNIINNISNTWRTLCLKTLRITLKISPSMSMKTSRPINKAV